MLTYSNINDCFRLLKGAAQGEGYKRRYELMFVALVSVAGDALYQEFKKQEEMVKYLTLTSEKVQIAKEKDVRICSNLLYFISSNLLYFCEDGSLSLYKVFNLLPLKLICSFEIPINVIGEVMVMFICSCGTVALYGLFTKFFFLADHRATDFTLSKICGTPTKNTSHLSTVISQQNAL
jgi:hypothetical protein